MTQQEMSRLLDISDRTLRDWKKSRNRLYTLLENLDYNEAKNKININDIDDVVEFNPKKYTYNCFWQTNKPSQQKVYSIISNYLGTMNKEDITTLCKEYGKNMVRNVLERDFKIMYKKGFISASGIDIPLYGAYNNNELYKETVGIINDC